MAETLTAAAVAKLKPAPNRREIPDAGGLGLHLIIHPSGKKSWAIRYRRPGGEPAKLTLGTCDVTGAEITEPVLGGHLTLSGARRLAADMRHKIASGLDPAKDWMEEKQKRRAPAETGGSTFGPAAIDFMREHKVRKTGERPRRWREIARTLGLDYAAPGSPEKGEPAYVKGGLAGRWKDKPIGDVTGHDVHSVIMESRRGGIPGMVAKNPGTSEPRARRMADALGSLFKWAMKYRRAAMRANPITDVSRPDPGKSRARVLNVKLDVRRADELRWFWAACDEVSEPFGDLLKLLLITGCRRDEIARMTNDELSDNAVMLRLPGERTKNHLPHDVPLPPIALAILRRRRERRAEKCRYLFSTNDRTPVSGFSKIKKRLDGIMLRLAREERGEDFVVPPWRVHDLRRTCSTGMAGLKIPPHVVEACLNHVSGAKAGVAGTYNHEAYEEEKREALACWATHVLAAVSGNVLPMKRQA